MGRELISVSEMVAFVPALGSVLLWDDFEKVFKWTGAGSPAGWTVGRSQLKVWREDYSMRLLTATPAAGQKASAYASINSYLSPAKMGLVDFFFYFLESDYTDFIAWQLSCIDSGKTRSMGIRYDNSGKKLQYLAYGGAWVDIPGGAVDLAEDSWHRLTVDFDFIGLVYGYVVLDVLLLNLSGTSIHYSVFTAPTKSYNQIMVQSKMDRIGELFVDDFYMRASYIG